MTDELEQRLTTTLERAAEFAPVPAYDPVGAVQVRRRHHRRRRVATVAAAVLVLTGAAGVAVRHPSGPEPRPAPGLSFSPDRIPDFARLPDPGRVWPGAVHTLPATLPDGHRYGVAALLGDDRYLVARDGFVGVATPSIFDSRRGTLTEIGGPAVTDGLVRPSVLMARRVGGQVIWLLEGTRRDRWGRELWVAPLDGGAARLLTTVQAPRFTVAGDRVVWEYEVPGTAERPGGLLVDVRSVPLAGGRVTQIPDSDGFSLAFVGPWITDQRIGTGLTARDAGVLRNLATGERLDWRANPDLRYVQCNPAWCSGRGADGSLGLQELDGTGLVRLPYRGTLQATAGGRVVVGGLSLPAGVATVVWDRATGRAAATVNALPEGHDGEAGPQLQQLFDWEPEVLTLRTTEAELVVFDLRVIR
ncbi:hypothetical protein [Micromonospora maritima]|uniref:hypothetical protein n=1 Tax=Micromonospora maritima TaxID=986711 RepID=UPI00157D9787|nr:hypothetical protein [Micromonospora maritima]